jgi:hypothetical protein
MNYKDIYQWRLCLGKVFMMINYLGLSKSIRSKSDNSIEEAHSFVARYTELGDQTSKLSTPFVLPSVDIGNATPANLIPWLR